MSISPEFREIGNFISRRVPEKSNFSQTCNLLSQFLKDKGNLAANPRALEKAPAMDLFPQHTGFGSSAAMEDSPKITQLSEIKMPKASQMTIMYAGKVLVFDEIPEEKVKELMSLATNASLQNTVPLNSNSDLKTGAKVSAQETKPNPRPIPAHVSGLPIARKASLHRFLEKRKDRINARAPYQMNAPTTTKPKESSKAEEPKSWLGLASPCSSDLGL